MKCKDCTACQQVKKQRWTRDGLEEKEVYECWGVKNTFEIENINHECYAYPKKKQNK